MSKQIFTETDIQTRLRDSESNLDRSTLNALATSREQAVSAQNNWFGEYRGLFSAGLAAAVLVIALLVPLGQNNQSQPATGIDVADETLQLMLDDPEFFLWVSGSYSSVSQ